MKEKVKYLIICLFILFFESGVFAQFQGLHFNSNSKYPHETTGINLFNGDFFEFDTGFEIKFDLKIRNEPYQDFGYILRVVCENGKNIDIIYDNSTKHKNDVIIVYNAQFSKVSLNIEKFGLLNNWHTVHLKVDLENDLLVFQVNDSVFIEKNLGLESEKHFKFLFGTNHFELFETTKTPPMDIRDIIIATEGKQLYHWPLSEESGNYAKDILDGKRATIFNPVWLKRKHSNWDFEDNISCTGRAEILLNAEEDSLIILSESGLSYYSLNSKKILSKDSLLKIKDNSLGYELVSKTNSKNFFIVNAGNREVIDFNRLRKKFIEKYPPEYSLPSNWHSNIVYAPATESILVFGGFDGEKYFNTVISYNLLEDRWDTIITKGDNIEPRYRASMGINNSSDTIYFLGGYGSTTGNALLNPHYFSNLFSYSIKDNSFQKIFDYRENLGMKAFSKTMFIDTENNSFYTLFYDPLSNNPKLQLIKGSLKEPVLERIANEIPFSYEPQNSKVKIYFSYKLQKLFAFITNYNDTVKSSTINVYSIMYPPRVQNELTQNKSPRRKMWIWIFIIIAFDLVLITISVIKKIKGKSAKLKTINTQPEPGFFSTDLLKNTWKSENQDKGTPLPENRIYLFGGFQLYIGSDNEVSKKFSPILKELFLLILLHSSENLKGVSTKYLIEQLWGDMSLKNAKNNLSVNINKLRAIMGVELSSLMSNISGHWKLDLEGKSTIVFCDYWEVWRILRTENISSKVPISNIMEIIQRGGLLLNSNYEWLDTFKSKISNELIDLLTDYSAKKGTISDPDFAIKIADTIFLFDMINEQAMEIKCNALAKLGKHSMSSDTYNKFIKEYMLLYDEPYNRTLKDIIE